MKRSHILAGISMMCLTSLSAMAGEPIIFEKDTKLTLPKEELDPDKLRNTGPLGGKKSSSVDAVVAPWQNPLNSSKMDAKRRKAFLEALDKKNNWAFQSTDEYLGNADLDNFDVDDDSFLTTDLDSKSSRQLAERVFYSNRKKSGSKLERNKKNANLRNNSLDIDNDKEITGADLLGEDGLATPSYYQHQFDNLFKSNELLRGERGGDPLTTMSQREITAANMLGMGDLVPDQLNKNSAGLIEMQSMQSLLNTGGNLLETESGNSATGLSGRPESGLPGAGGNASLISNWQGSGASLPGGSRLSGATPSGTLDSLNATRGFSGNSLNLGNAGLAPSTLGGGAFQLSPRPSAAPSKPRPIFFEIPKRAF